MHMYCNANNFTTKNYKSIQHSKFCEVISVCVCVKMFDGGGDE